MDDFQRSATVLAALAITAAMHADLATKAFTAPLWPTFLASNPLASEHDLKPSDSKSILQDTCEATAEIYATTSAPDFPYLNHGFLVRAPRHQSHPTPLT